MLRIGLAIHKNAITICIVEKSIFLWIGNARVAFQIAGSVAKCTQSRFRIDTLWLLE